MRKTVCINENWFFSKTCGVLPDALPAGWEKVNLPHTWNAADGQDGGNDYYRGICWYARSLYQPCGTDGLRSYLEFEGAAMAASVYVNGTNVCSHEGGYSTFRADITDHLRVGENLICVSVDNGVNDRIYPQMADFTFYGGLYRNVNLITVPETHFDLDYYGAPGLAYTAKTEGETAAVSLKAWVTAPETGDSVCFTILDSQGITAAQGYTPAEACSSTVLCLTSPHVWQGVLDPYLYTVRAELVRRNERIDCVNVKMGIREFSVDPEKGFLLNGIPTPLRGVSRHQDRLGVGSALTREQNLEDAELIREIGANTVRLAHYQHSQDFYEACDAMGFVVWAEIPFISRMSGNPAAHENCILQLKELILQNYNHPSICFWGISNEITIGGDSPQLHRNLRELNDLAHAMDSTRLTTMAHISMLEPDNEQVYLTDVMSYNHYFGWYGGKLTGTEAWMDKFHEAHPNRPVGISEYGAEANITYHSSEPRCRDYSEEYQALYHEHLAEVISRRPYIWATHVWNMFDFGCDARDEGGVKGRNNKGLVTLDRTIKKDAFYIYKAYWSREPFVHICGRRFARRTGDFLSVKVYSNLPAVTLFLDGIRIADRMGDKVFEFQEIPWTEGIHFIRAVGQDCEDCITLERVTEPWEPYILVDEEAAQGDGAANWFTNLIVETPPEMTFDPQYFSVKDRIRELLGCNEAMEAVVGAMYSSSGMKFKKSMLSMMGDNTLEDLQEMIDKASGEENSVKPSMKQVMTRLNAVLQTIRKS